MFRSLAMRRGLSIEQLDSVRNSELSLGEIIDQYLESDHHIIDLPDEHADESVQAQHPSITTNSIPLKLRKYYSHASFRQIILSTLSIISIIGAFIGLYTKLIEECACLGFVTSVLLLFSPSPLGK